MGSCRDRAGRWSSWLAASAVLGCAAWSAPALAQAAGDGAATEAPCKSFMKAMGEQEVPSLHVACEGTGFVLGPSDKATLIYNPALQATLVDTIWQGDRRVWLIGKAPDKVLYLEELSGTLARAGGRGARLDPSGLKIDLTQFAGTGLVTIEPEADAEAAAGATGKVDLAALMKLIAKIRAANTGAANTGAADGGTAAADGQTAG